MKQSIPLSSKPNGTGYAAPAMQRAGWTRTPSPIPLPMAETHTTVWSQSLRYGPWLKPQSFNLSPSSIYLDNGEVSLPPSPYFSQACPWYLRKTDSLSISPSHLCWSPLNLLIFVYCKVVYSEKHLLIIFAAHQKTWWKSHLHSAWHISNKRWRELSFTNV